MAVIIPEQIYIGYDERKEAGDWRVPETERETTLLGFATYYVDDKAFVKRKSTIDHWAKDYSVERLQRDDPRWDTTSTNQHYQEIKTMRPDLAASYIDNPLQTGFKISKSVRRYGWGSGNVLWRIEDPRGFELEISSANMASIMDCCTLDHGEVTTPCRWGWDKSGGSKVVLLPEGSEPYIEATKDTKRANTKVALKDVNLGDTVVTKKGLEGVYLGGWWAVMKSYEKYDEIPNPNAGRSGWYGRSGMVDRNGHTWKPVKRYVLQVGETLAFLSRADVSEITNKIEVPIEKDIAETHINDMLKNWAITSTAVGTDREYAWDDGFCLVSSKKINPGDMTFEFRELTEDQLKNKDLARYDVFSPIDDGHWMQLDLRYLQNEGTSARSSTYFVEAEPLENLFIMNYNSTALSQNFFGSSCRETEIERARMLARKWSFIYINYKGLVVPGKS